MQVQSLTTHALIVFSILLGHSIAKPVQSDLVGSILILMYVDAVSSAEMRRRVPDHGRLSSNTIRHPQAKLLSDKRT